MEKSDCRLRFTAMSWFCEISSDACNWDSLSQPVSSKERLEAEEFAFPFKLPAAKKTFKAGDHESTCNLKDFVLQLPVWVRMVLYFSLKIQLKEKVSLHLLFSRWISKEALHWFYPFHLEMDQTYILHIPGAVSSLPGLRQGRQKFFLHFSVEGVSLCRWKSKPRCSKMEQRANNWEYNSQSRYKQRCPGSEQFTYSVYILLVDTSVQKCITNYWAGSTVSKKDHIRSLRNSFVFPLFTFSMVSEPYVLSTAVKSTWYIVHWNQ